MKVSDLGEFGLISHISAIISQYRDRQQPSWQAVVVDSGDDAAAWQTDSTIQLATTDTLVQDVHFDLGIISWEELGWKALAVNLSDIAAMGGIPQYALISLSLPGEVALDDISEFSRALAHLAREFGVAIVGGNIAAAAKVVITGTIIGCSRGPSILRRSTASPGEQVAITGYPGLSAAGLEMLTREIKLDRETTGLLRRAHFKPTPKIREGQALVENGVRTAIDISDGLIADLDHICEMSRVSATISTGLVPLHDALRANFADCQDLALCGGEDYELLFTADESAMARVRSALQCPVTVIGQITDQDLARRVTVVDSKGDVLGYSRKGWQHFGDGIPESRLRQP